MKLFSALVSKIFAFIGWFFRLSLLKKGIFIAIVLFIGWLVFFKFAPQNNAASQYQTATVERGTLITSVTSSGTVSSGSRASITTQASGVVSEVYVKNGDYVNQGDKIATLSLDPTSEQKQEAAYASYLSAQNNLNDAQAKINSLQSALFKANQTFINDKGIANPTDQNKADPKYIEENADWLQAEADYKNQQSVIAQAQAALSSASLSYAQTSSTVTAPIAGYISNLSITPGFPIVNTSSGSNNSNPTATTLGNITLKDVKQTATVNLTEIDVTNVKVGQRVTMTLDAFPKKTFTGKVSAIDTNGVVSSGVTTYPTTITFDSAPDNMYPNMAVNATIILNIKDNVLLVPTSAVHTQNGSSTVQVLKNGQPQDVDVEVGDSSDTQTEITSGLNEGDTVVVGTVAKQTGGTQSSSPFGGTGFGGGNRGFGGGGGGGAQRAVFIQRGG